MLKTRSLKYLYINKKITAIVLAVIMVCGMIVPAFAASDITESDSRRDIINTAELNDPVSPKSADLDAYLDELMPEIISDDMDTFEQLKACYDYVIQNTKYGTHYTQTNMAAKVGSTTCGAIYRKYGEVEGFGAVALVQHVGLCNAYASAFIMMARKLGFDAYLVKGITKSGGGSYAYHEWCEINIDGTIYVFDPQLDPNLSRSGLKKYSVFCVTYEQIPGRYRK